MCGFAGVVNAGSPALLRRMLKVQEHRGPDDEGCDWTETRSGNVVGLGSRRLSIIDLTRAGHMPMWNADRTIGLAYNGEVYNFAELRGELQRIGHTFRTRTDTEVVLAAYEQYGVDCFRRLRGMFACCLWDDRRSRLVLARDPFGIKPFYYFHSGRTFACASELKALLELPEVDRTIDLECVNQYLTFLWVPEPRTLLKHVHKLPAGHYAVLKDGVFRATEYWDATFPPEQQEYTRPVDDLREETRQRLAQSVDEQLVSDRPIGAFLSAGLDSMSIVASIPRERREHLRTYTITFPSAVRRGEVGLDDPDVARRAARVLGTQHQEIVVEPKVADLLEKLVWHMDDPVADPAIVMDYLVCHEAARSSIVLLSGVGGDEIFGGYRKYCAHYLAGHYQKIPGVIRRRLIEPLVRRLPPLTGTRCRGWVRLMKKMAASGSLPPRERFLTDSTYMSPGFKSALLTPEMWDQTREFDPWTRHREAFDKMQGADFLHQMLYVDTKTFLPSLNLNYNDKMSMACSVEVRVPFLDTELYEFVAWQVPPGAKVRTGRSIQTKTLLREAMEGVVPPEVLRQRKAGFAAPVGAWLRGELREMLAHILLDGRLASRGIFSPAQVERLVCEHVEGRRDHALQLWQLLTLELWFRQFVDTRSPGPVGANSPDSIGAGTPVSSVRDETCGNS